MMGGAAHEVFDSKLMPASKRPATMGKAVKKMASRPLIVATLLGASVGVPYLASQSQHAPTAPSLGATPVSSQSQPWSWNKTAAMPVANVQPLPSAPIMRLPGTASATDGAQFTSA